MWQPTDPAQRRRAYLAWLQPHDLRGRNLRYSLLTVLHDAARPMRIAELIAELQRLGLVIGGRDPHKTVGDVLRYEVGRGRIRRVERGVYRIGEIRPAPTVYRHRRRLQDLVAEGRRRAAVDRLAGRRSRCDDEAPRRHRGPLGR